MLPVPQTKERGSTRVHALNNVNKVLQVLHQNNVSSWCFLPFLVLLSIQLPSFGCCQISCMPVVVNQMPFRLAWFPFSLTVQHNTARKKELQWISCCCVQSLWLWYLWICLTHCLIQTTNTPCNYFIRLHVLLCPFIWLCHSFCLHCALYFSLVCPSRSFAPSCLLLLLSVQ